MSFWNNLLGLKSETVPSATAASSPAKYGNERGVAQRFARVFLDPQVELLGPKGLFEDGDGYDYRKRNPPGTFGPDLLRRALVREREILPEHRWDKDRLRHLEHLERALCVFEPTEFRNTEFFRNSGLLGAALEAHAKHQAFVLSPECVMFAVTQAVAQCIFKHDSGRIDPEDREEMRVDIMQSEAPNGHRAAYVAANLSQELVITDPLASQIVKPVAATGAYQRCPPAFDIAFLHAFKARYKYVCGMYSCGIPKVILEGSPEEWMWIAMMISTWEKIEELGPMAKWFAVMRETCMRLARLDPMNREDCEWMQRMCYYTLRSSSPSLVSGWIANFFPYYPNYGRGDGAEEAPELRTEFPIDGGVELKVDRLSEGLFASVPVLMKWHDSPAAEEPSVEFDIELRSGIDAVEEAHDEHMNLYRPVLDYGIWADVQEHRLR